jgi:hypothetical protein
MKSKKMFWSCLFFCLVTASNAQTGGCTTVLAERSGSVLPAAPARIVANPNVNQVIIEVTKEPSGAETLAKIYINDVLTHTLSFPNGVTYARTETYTAQNVSGKEIKVVISNSSAALRSDYTCKIKATISSLVPGGNPVTGNLAGQTQKTVQLNHACGNQVRIVVRRTSGQAVGNIFIYQGNSQNPLESHILEKEEDQKVIILNGSHNKNYRIVVKNQSIGNFLGYFINGVQL